MHLIAFQVALSACQTPRSAASVVLFLFRLLGISSDFGWNNHDNGGVM